MKFITDRDLNPLTKRLRMLGFDCLYNGGWSFSDLISVAVREERVLLTRKTVPLTNRLRVFTLRDIEPHRQLQSVVDRFALQDQIQPFTRCLLCNAQIIECNSSSDILETCTPKSVQERGLPVYRCPECERLYWHGSHVERMIKELQRAKIEL